jgi:hypothetical protein
MPKELARVMARYNNMQNQVKPLLSELTDHGHDYILMRDHLSIFLDQLAGQLKDLGVKTAADPRAAKDAGVMDTLEEIEKRKLLMADRHAQFGTAAKKVDPIRAEVVKLQKDVVAVVKAKSGFFSTSKSLPQLKALSTTLLRFADDLETATSLVN